MKPAGYDLAAEQAVIGAALLAPALMGNLAGLLSSGDFGRPAHRVLWAAMCGMHAAGTPTDTITVAAHLADTGELGKVGGAPYLHTLIADVPTTANAAHYANIVADLGKRRQVADLGAQLARLATSGADTADVVATGRAMLEGASSLGEWPALVPLGRGRHLPPFPAEVLPGWLADQVLAVAEFTQTPIDLAGSLALACLSTAAGGRAEVEVRGSWREPTNLYTVVVLPPGSRKSAVFAAMVGPILSAEKAMIERTAPAIIEAELSAKVATKAAEKAALAAASADAAGRDTLIAEATAAAMNAEAITVPAKPRLVADDITSETAASLLAEQGGRLAVLSPEGGIFATIAGRYSGTPNLEVFLKGHAGDLMRVDRRSREAEHVDKPALTMGLAVQPEILRDIAGMPGFRGLGLLARILFALPENTVGRRKIGADPIPTQVAAAYHGGLHALVLSLAEWTDPTVIVLAPDANERVLEIERLVEPRLAPGGAWSHIVDWGSKYAGAVVRIAGLLHLAERPGIGWSGNIHANTIDRAALIGEYYAAHALAAFDDMGADIATRNGRLVLAWIERTATSAFTKREAFRAVQCAQIKTVADLDPALAVLEAHGYLRQLDPPAPKRAGGRPPSPSYLVHPEVHRPAATVHPLNARKAS
ncbi:YfjI family protein [Paractinoplanes atraurantiacus]|uniref:DnaB-like helicase N terminal domain-containing protein n=1 Tax=Paractinoplanes atraurantiacus TaxID=1036182 RepID=A0A285JFQ5_9ACTN|nr:YfjI family protein [Actinoplanes atraurantiacus]SNY58216.1 DnaB-like helicase N terminal domain-containing protein [Actinoplanes atraurantiacus]